MTGLALAALDLPRGEVERRFASARRRGQPNWLWPEVAIADWQNALAAIERAVRAVLGGESSPPLLDVPAEALGIACYTSGTGPLLGHWIAEGRLAASSRIEALLALHLCHNRLRMERLGWEATRLATAFDRAEVPCTFLKGMHTAHAYFPDPATRPCADIDVLVAPEQGAAAGRVLADLGYVAGRADRWPSQRTWRKAGSPASPASLSLVHSNDPWSVDLQTSLNRRYSTGSPVVRLDPIARSNAPWPLRPSASALAQPLLLVHLAAHASCGLASLNLLRLVELHLVIRADSANGSLDWDEVTAGADAAGALGMIYPALRLCEALVPGTVPPGVLRGSRARVPSAVRRIVDPLTPATAHRVVRCSLAERFMWTASPAALARELFVDTFAPGTSVRDMLRIQGLRMWRIARATVTR